MELCTGGRSGQETYETRAPALRSVVRSALSASSMFRKASSTARKRREQREGNGRIAISQALPGSNGWFGRGYRSSVRSYGSSGWQYGSSVCASGSSAQGYGSLVLLYRSGGRVDGAGVRLSGPFGWVFGSGGARSAGSAGVARADASCINDGAGLRCTRRPRVDGVVHTFTHVLQKSPVTSRAATRIRLRAGKETAHGCGLHSSRGQGFY